MDETREELLAGGNVSHGIVRIGDTVRRPAGPWTPAVHAFLRHLEAHRFEGAPRVLGIDDAGREILEYIPGQVAWSERHKELLGTDDAMHRIGRLLRDLHDASASFEPPPDAIWRDPEREDDARRFVDDRGMIVCHNDPAAWNLIVGESRWALIDWDFAGPRPFIWDVAYAMIGMVPIAREASWLGWPDELPIVERTMALIDGYRLETRDRVRLVDAIEARLASSYNHLKRNAEAGVEPWRTLWMEGHGRGWADNLAFAKENHVAWQRAFEAG